MKILIDMNLTPLWGEYFAAHGVESKHWSEIGPFSAPDPEIMNFALSAGFVVFTHDLDFGSILAVTNARGPSVIQVRTQDPIPEVVGELIVSGFVIMLAILNAACSLQLSPSGAGRAYCQCSPARSDAVVTTAAGITEAMMNTAMALTDFYLLRRAVR